MTFRSLALVTIAYLLSAPASFADSAARHGLSAFGALKYPSGFTQFDYVNPDAPKGGALSILTDEAQSSFDTLNPFILQGDPAQGMDTGRDPGSLLHVSLMVRAYDEPDAVYGLAAQAAEVAADRSWVVFTIRPQARFHDNSPITAKDVVFTFYSLKEKGHPQYAVLLKDVVAAEVLAERKVKFVFDLKGKLRDLPMIVAQLPILSKAYYSTHDFEAPSLEPPLGSGPYKIGKIQSGRTISYERIPNHWAADLPVMRGRFNFDQIRIEYFRDRGIALEAFLAGEYDIREEFTSKSWATQYRGPGVEAGWITRASLPDNRPSGAQAFFLNTRRPHFQDPRVRQAFDLAFDFEWTNATIFYGAYARTTSMFENSDMTPRGAPGGAELASLAPFRGQLPPQVFGEPYSPPASDGSGNDRNNLRRAAKLLRDAGWRAQDGVLVNKAGEPLSIEFLAFEETFNRVVLPYFQNLKLLGIQARVRLVDSAQYQRRMEEFDFDVTTRRFVMPLTPGVEQRNLWSSDAAGVVGSANMSGIKSPVVDALIEALIGAGDRESLRTAVRALDRVIMHGHYLVPHWYKASHSLAWWDKFSWPEVKPPFARGVIDTWWYDEDKAATLAAKREN